MTKPECLIFLQLLIQWPRKLLLLSLLLFLNCHHLYTVSPATGIAILLPALMKGNQLVTGDKLISQVLYLLCLQAQHFVCYITLFLAFLQSSSQGVCTMPHTTLYQVVKKQAQIAQIRPCFIFIICPKQSFRHVYMLQQKCGVASKSIGPVWSYCH